MKANSSNRIEQMTDTERALFDVLQAIVSVLGSESQIRLALLNLLTELEISYNRNNEHRGPGGWVVRRLQSIASSGNFRPGCSNCGR